MSREKKSLSNVKIIIDHAALMGHNRLAGDLQRECYYCRFKGKPTCPSGAR